VSGPDVRAIPTGDLPEEAFPTVNLGFRVVLAEEAFDRAVARAEEDPDREIGGVLVGRLRRDSGGPFVRVETTVDALHAEEKSTELTFTHETWAHIHEVMDREHPDREIVGWYHTHPGFGVFLSDRDEFIHRSFFDSPHQVALVYDPQSREHGIFAWHEDEPERCRRYWVGAAEQTWEPPAVRTKKPVKEAKDAKDGSGPAMDPVPQPRQEETPPLDRFTLVIGAAVLLILGGLVGYWLSGGSGGVSEEKRRQEIAAAQVAGMQETIKRLNLELFALVRQSMDGETIRRSRDAMERLDRGLAVLLAPDATDATEAGEAARAQALATVTRARHELRTLVAGQARAATTLNAIVASRSPLDDPRLTREALSRHEAALGQAFVELADAAAKAGDVRRARRLLLTAGHVDPSKRPLYEKKIAALPGDEGGGEK